MERQDRYRSSKWPNSNTHRTLCDAAAQYCSRSYLHIYRRVSPHRAASSVAVYVYFSFLRRHMMALLSTHRCNVTLCRRTKAQTVRNIVAGSGWVSPFFENGCVIHSIQSSNESRISFFLYILSLAFLLLDFLLTRHLACTALYSYYYCLCVYTTR